MPFFFPSVCNFYFYTFYLAICTKPFHIHLSMIQNCLILCKGWTGIGVFLLPLYAVEYPDPKGNYTEVSLCFAHKSSVFIRSHSSCLSIVFGSGWKWHGIHRALSVAMLFWQKAHSQTFWYQLCEPAKTKMLCVKFSQLTSCLDVI